MIQKKVCMVGAFAVGKTSLIQRYVHRRYSEKYLTTVGVKVDRREVALGDRRVNLVLWDLAGEDDLMPIRSSYLRGSDGCLFVVDLTRPDTLDTARTLSKRVTDEVGSVPRIVALNKSDLVESIAVLPEQVDALAADGFDTVRTSAKNGEGVIDAFEILARRMVDGE